MYAEMHARSAFSFLEGASLPEDLIHRCAELEIPAMALIDTDNVSGAPRFYMAAKKLGIRPHMGAEITAAAGGRYTLLVENRTGYQNLCRLISSMKLRSEKGTAAATEAEFRQYATGLIALADGSQPFEKLLDIYGAGNVYAEVQRHLIRGQEAANERVRELARQWAIPVIATNGVRFTLPKKRPLMDVLTCTRHKTNVAQAGRLLEHNAERYLKPSAAMRRLFSDTPQEIDKALELSSRLQFTLAELGYEFPRYPVPPGETMDSFLRAQTLKGALGRYDGASRKSLSPNRARTRSHSKTKTARLFSDRLGHCRVLPPARHSGAGPGLGGEQRGLLFAGNHRDRSRQNGAAVRAFPLGGARRMA